MKKLLLIGMIIAAVCCGCGTNKGNEYALVTVVCEVDDFRDEVTCMDFNGNKYIFSGCEDWFVGDYCAMIMNDNGTDEICDDEIVSYRCDGWLSGQFGIGENGEYIFEIY